MSFWKHSPGPTWFDYFTETFIKRPPSIIRKGLPEFQEMPDKLKAFTFSKMKAENYEEYKDFLKRHFKTSAYSYFLLPAWSPEWIGIEARKDGKLIGTIVSKKTELGFENSGIIDFFCVDSQYSKRGIGSRLLYEIDLETSLQKRFTHIFMKEKTPILLLPALISGQWTWRKTVHGNPTLSTARMLENSGKECPNSAIWRKTVHNQTSQAAHNAISIIDTNERTLPLGQPIGQLFIKPGYKEQSEEIINNICDNSPYSIVMSTTNICPNWTKDSYFYIYAYNWRPGDWSKTITV